MQSDKSDQDCAAIEQTAANSVNCGCNWQAGNFVLGGEADIDFADVDADRDAGVVLEPASDGWSARSTTSGRTGSLAISGGGNSARLGAIKSAARSLRAGAFSGKVVTGFP
jgi:hypothetical protein